MNVTLGGFVKDEGSFVKDEGSKPKKLGPFWFIQHMHGWEVTNVGINAASRWKLDIDSGEQT